MRSASVALIAFSGAILTGTSAAHACVSHSGGDTVCLPGFGLTGFHVGLALPIFAAFIERPFFSRAGVDASPLAYALQANFLSAITTGIAGLLVMSTAWPDTAAMLMWMPASMACGVAIEWNWLRRQCGRPIDVRWLAVANVLSAAAIFALPFLREAVAPGTQRNRYFAHDSDNRTIIALATLTACATVCFVAFCRTAVARTNDPRRGFEVLPASPRRQG